MEHIKIIQNTSGIEEVDASIISKLYELASSGDLDNSSDLKGRLHSSTAKEKHVTYLNNNFDELYITADIQYLSFDDPDMETYMKRYIGTDDGVSLQDIQTFITSGVALGDRYTNNHNGNTRTLFITDSERESIDSFDEIYLFNGITTLDNQIFSDSNISSITLPSTITTLKDWAFSSCTSLTSINLDNVQYIYKAAFYNCTSLAIELNSSSIQSLDKKAFFGSGITKVKLSNLSSLYTNYNQNGKVFGNCTSLTEADFTGSTITTIDGFYGCTNLASVTIPSTVTRVEMQAFTNTKLTSFDFSNITELGRDCFKNTKLTSVDLSNITKIDNGAFSNCTQLTSITLPSGSFSWVTEGNVNEGNIFAGCTGLSQVIDLSNCSTFSGSWFRNCSSLTQVILPQNINKIYSEFFYHCSNLSSLGSKITPTYIGDRAFEDCTQIDNNDIDLSAATYIGHSAMKNTAISGVLNFTECLTLGQNPFNGCTGITEIHAPKLTDFNTYNTWDGFANLEVLDLPVSDRLNTVSNCPKLRTINAPLATKFSTYTSGKIYLSNCPLLSTLNINFSAVTEFGGWCFDRDTGLNGQYLDFPNVTLMESEALKSNGINFIFRNSSVITLTGYGWFNNYTGTIYVPDNLVATYKSTSGWSDIASQIKGISELPVQ